MIAPSNAFLAAADPLSHVVDEPLFHGLGGGLEGLGHHLHAIGLTKHSVLFMIAGLLTVLFFWSYAWSAGKERVPGRWGNFVEMVLEFLRDHLLRPFLGEAGDKYLPIIATFFIYIAIANLLGLVPILDYLGHGGNTATASFAITGGLAICSFFIYHWQGVKEQGHGFWHYLKHQIPQVPVFLIPLMVVIELAAHIIRPFALAIRLFANMLAGHTMVAAILGFTAVFTQDFMWGGGVIALVSVIAVTLLTFLEILIAFIQAFVFAFLTTVFLAMAVNPEH